MSENTITLKFTIKEGEELKLSNGLSLTASFSKPAGGGAFDPTSLFASGEAGAVFVADPASCFTDVAMTIPAGDGDAVAVVADLSGNENHATQQFSSRYPTLRLDASGYYLDFDGLNSSMITPSINFAVSDKISVFAGLTRDVDTPTGMLLELSPTVTGNDGAFYITAPEGGFSNKFIARGTEPSAVAMNTEYVGPAAPETYTLTGLSDISADTNILRINGVLTDTAVTELGAGAFGNYPLYIGARNLSTIRFNGGIRCMIVRSGLTSGAELADTEAYVADKSGVSI